MKNSAFSQEQMKVLLHPEKWRFFCRHHLEGISPLRNSKRLAWSMKHGHSHPNRELLIPLSGRALLGLGGKVYPCDPGTLFFFDAFETHDVGYPEESPDLDHLWIVFLPSHIFVNLARLRHGALTLIKIIDFDTRATIAPDLSGGLDLVWTDSRSLDSEFRRFLLLGAFTRLVETIVRKSFSRDPKEEKEMVRRMAVEKMCLHIENCGGRGINLDNLARIAGYSKFHFHRLFKRETGKSLHEYIDLCRLARTRQRLSEGFSKKEICYELGFSSPAAFSRWYGERHA